MDARTYYISLLKSPVPRHVQSRSLQETIRKGMLDWIMYRRYTSSEDSLDRLATEMGVTKEDISAFLTACTGNKLRVIKKELRLSDAAQMMKDNPELSFYQVSKSVGIDDKSNFRRMFKEDFGCTPTIWKKSKGNPCLSRFILMLEKGRNHCPSHRKTS